MSINEQPAAMSHLEIQMTALLKRSLQDDVPTDVFRQVRDAFDKMKELQAELTKPAPKKNLFNRKK